MPITEYDHSPQDDVLVRFDDKTGEQRTPEQMGEMLEALRAVANEYNFDIAQWGNESGFAFYYRNTQAGRIAVGLEPI